MSGAELGADGVEMIDEGAAGEELPGRARAPAVTPQQPLRWPPYVDWLRFS